MAQVFSEVTAFCNHPKDYDTRFLIPRLIFHDVPDWVLDSSMFKALEGAKKIRVINGKSDISKIENMNGKIAQAGLEAEEAKAEQEKEDTGGAETNIKYDDMKAMDLYKMCVDAGIKIQKQLSKEEYIKALTEGENSNDK